MQTLSLVLKDAIDPDMSEGTSFPWWIIVDPKPVAGRLLDFDGAITAIAMAAVTGPFFSREEATDFLEATRYNFGAHAVVWCSSGNYSKGYRELLRLAKVHVPFYSANEADFINAFQATMAKVHDNSVDKGWHKEERNEGEMIALEHAELSECLEALRHGNPPSEHIPEFTGAEEELADVVIRIMDHASAKGHRVAEAIVAKMAFNKTRPQMHGGKLF
jgi:NTP pyrophosphatase (non-canonical NTP hydrolase)